MAKQREVTIRIRIADYELEVTGPKKWADKTIKEFVENVKKQSREAEDAN